MEKEAKMMTMATILCNISTTKYNLKSVTRLRDIAALAAIYGYLVALDLAYRKNIYCYNGNNSIIDNDRTIASSRRSS